MAAVRNLLLLTLVGFTASCAGFRPVAPAPQRIYAGETATIELPEPPPAGVTLRWDPGDGSDPVEGAVLRHVWQRPGSYEVQVEGPGGGARFPVEVEPRPLLRAMPPSVRGAIAVPGAWSRFDDWMALVARFAPRSDVATVLARFAERLGADPAQPDELVEIGIDPAEGVGFVTFDFDDDATWILVGILDEEKALATAQRLFDLESLDRLETPVGRLYVGATPVGGIQAFGLVGGYLVIRGGDTTPLALREAFAAFAEAGDGLQASPSFAKARAFAPGGDLVVYVHREEGDGAFGSVVTAIDLGEDEVIARFGIALLPAMAGEPDAGGFGAAAAPAPQLAQYPGGAVAFFSLSFDPVRAVHEMARHPMHQAMFAHAVRDATGVPLEDLLAAFTGNVSAGLYFDAEAFAEVVARITEADPDADPTPPFFARIELREGAADVIDRAIDRLGRPTGDGWWQRGPWFFRRGDGFVEIASLRARHLRPRPEGTRDFSGLLPAEPGTQAVYFDVAAVIDALRRSEAKSPGAAMVRTLLLEEAAFLAPVRAVRASGRAVPGGVIGTLQLDLHPLGANAPQGGAVFEGERRSNASGPADERPSL